MKTVAVLPKPIGTFLKGLTFCFFFVLAIQVFRNEPVFHISFLELLFLAYVNYEANRWFGTKFFAYTYKRFPGRWQKKIFFLLILFYIGVVLISGIVLIVYTAGLHFIKGTSLHEIWPNTSGPGIHEAAIWIPVGLLVGTVIIFYILWQESVKNEQKLREEKLIFQIETLKNQINPHFLFNSLNTLSSLIGSNPELADQFVLKLSAIYRYVIEKTEQPTIDLETELQFVKEYFYLQQIRDENKIQLHISVETPSKYNILPLSLQLLVENALKHNSATRSKPLKIDIDIVDEYIVVKNNLQKKTTIANSPGIGLNNLAQRTKLSTNRELIVEENIDNFIVKVPLIRQA